MKNLRNRVRKVLLGVLSILGFAGMASAACSPGEIEVTVDITTDNWGYEAYWELTPSGLPCGDAGMIFAGGNIAEVGCTPPTPGISTNGNGYAINSTISEGPFCLTTGSDYDIISVDDFGDGGSVFTVIIGGVPLYMFTANAVNNTFTFTADLPDNNLAILQEYYDTIAGGADSSSTIYYTNMPLRQAEMDLIWFAGDIGNQGVNDATNVIYGATVTHGSNTVFDDKDPSFGNLNAGLSKSSIVPSSFTPMATGTYEMMTWVEGDATDDLPGDNMTMATLEVTDTVYARDDDNYNGWGTWNGPGTVYKMANWFEVGATDTATSISIFLQGNTDVGAIIQVHLMDNALVPIPGASSAFITLTANEIGAWTTIDIPDTEMPGPAGYGAAIEVFSGDVLVAISADVDAPIQTSFIEDAGTWFFLGSTPYIRLNTKAPAINCNLGASTATGINLTCAGGGNGAATVVGAGGTGPYAYLWDDPSASIADSVGALQGGVYNVLITDANACMYNIAVTVTEPDPTGVSLATTNVTCNGGSDGMIGTVVTGGTGPFSYVWSDTTLTGASAAGLSAGTYSVTVTDANACPSANASVTLTEPVAMTLAFSQVTASCGGGGSATVVVTGGVGPYMYLWNDAMAQTTATASGLPSESYMCTVTDSNACVTTVTDSVMGTPAVTTTIGNTNPTACGTADGTAFVTIVTGTAPYAYAWNDPGTQNTDTATALAPGVYIVSVTDNNLCTTTDTVTLVDGAAATLQIATTNINCLSGSDGSMLVTPFGGGGGFVFAWNTSPIQTGATATGLSAGTYSVGVVDAGNCASFATATVTEPSTAVAIDAVTSTDVSCNAASDGTVTPTVSGGTSPYTPSWTSIGGFTSGSLAITGLGPDTYTLMITDANGCTVTGSGEVITEPTAMTATTTVTDVMCKGDATGGVDLTVTGGAGGNTFAWTGGSTSEDLSNVVAGNYTYTVTDSNGCSITNVVAISEPTALLTTSATSTDETTTGANDGTITATATGGTNPYSPAWTSTLGFSSTSLSISGLAPDTYTLVVTDANGCTSTLIDTVAAAPVGISEVINDVMFKVYPNPNTGQFIIELSNLNDGDYQIEIRNIIGQITFVENVNEQSGNFYKQIDLTSSETGVYFISLINDEGKTTKKLVVY